MLIIYFVLNIRVHAEIKLQSFYFPFTAIRVILWSETKANLLVNKLGFWEKSSYKLLPTDRTLYLCPV